MKRIAGKITIYIDGKKMFVGDSASRTGGNVTRADSIGKSGVAGYTETPIASKISCQIINTPDLPATDVDKVTNATIVFDENDGETQYTYFNCAYIGDPFELDQDGRGTAEFHSPYPPKKTK